jgi:hypothetical protein
MDHIKKTSLGRIPLEVSLVKLTRARQMPSLKEIMNRLSGLEGRLENSYAEEPARVERPGPAMKQEVAAERDILELQSIKDSWGKVLNYIKQRKMSVGIFLSEGELIRIKDGMLEIAFGRDNSLHKDALEGADNRKFVEEAIKSVTQATVRIKFITAEGKGVGEPEAVPAPAEEPAMSAPGRSGRVDPIIESAIDIFDGKIVNVRNGGGNRR